MISMSIVCTIYNHSEDVIMQMLKSLANCLQYCPQIDYDVIMVDNSDKVKLSYYPFQELFKQNVFQWVPTNSNLGYCGGNNFGVKYSNKDYIMIVNPDIVFTNSLCFDWILGSTILYNSISGRMVGKDNWYTYSSSFPTDKKYAPDKLPFYFREPTHQLPGNWKIFKYIDGSLMCFSRKLFNDIGGFDEDIFPGYFGENSFAFKAYLKGYKLIDCIVDKFYNHNSQNKDIDSIIEWSKIGRKIFYEKWALTNWDKFLQYLG